MVPLRVNVMTFNVWGNTFWPERRHALQETVLRADPDIVLLQEITPEILEALDDTLTSHSRIRNNAEETGFARIFTKGWTTESQIYYRKSMFDLVESGYEDLEILDHPDRGLFWARFLNEETGVIFIAATCHMPWPGCSEELASGVNQRGLCAGGDLTPSHGQGYADLIARMDHRTNGCGKHRLWRPDAPAP